MNLFLKVDQGWPHVPSWWVQILQKNRVIWSLGKHKSLWYLDVLSLHWYVGLARPPSFLRYLAAVSYSPLKPQEIIQVWVVNHQNWNRFLESEHFRYDVHLVFKNSIMADFERKLSWESMGIYGVCPQTNASPDNLGTINHHGASIRSFYGRTNEIHHLGSLNCRFWPLQSDWDIILEVVTMVSTLDQWKWIPKCSNNGSFCVNLAIK